MAQLEGAVGVDLTLSHCNVRKATSTSYYSPLKKVKRNIIEEGLAGSFPSFELYKDPREETGKGL